MCGRYTLQNTAALRDLYRQLGVETAMEFVRRFNVAPSQDVPVVVANGAGQPEARIMRWGVGWINEDSQPVQTINARSERLAFTRFKHAAQNRRCLVPACGFFEWSAETKPKTPYLFRVAGWEAFWIAGIWEGKSDEFVEGCLVLTTAPNDLVEPVHNRMPVIMGELAARSWLKPGPIEPKSLRMLCASFPSPLMTCTRVSPIVNNARNDSPECVAPIEWN